jgi:TonB family protein
MDSCRFQSLEFKYVPWTRWAVSAALHVGVLAFFLSLHIAVRNEARKYEQQVPATIATPLEAPVKMRAKIKPLQLPQLPSIRAKVEFKVPAPIYTESQGINVPLLPIQELTPIEGATPEIPKLEFAAPARPVINTDGASLNIPEPVSMKAPAKAVTQGGFDLQQSLGRSAASRMSSAAMAGFDTVGSGSGDRGKARGAVKTAGFGAYEPAPPPASAVPKPAAPLDTPVEILYKPKPQYTPEAREKKLEGEVQFEVLFSATGRIQVLRLLRGLGYGLDENARMAAEQIRFRPGTRNGAPVDMRGTVHIIFELS